MDISDFIDQHYNQRTFVSDIQPADIRAIVNAELLARIEATPDAARMIGEAMPELSVPILDTLVMPVPIADLHYTSGRTRRFTVGKFGREIAPPEPNG